MNENQFHATRWSLVLEARGRDATGQAALSDLCSIYYQPVVAFLRRDGRDEDTARDLAHAFFESLLTRGVGEPEPARGRFRSYLLGALKHFLIVRRTAESTSKRGGGQERVDWDAAMHELAIPAARDTAFDRDWALAVLATAMKAIEAEHALRPEVFRVLRPWLDGTTNLPQRDAADALGINETAVKVAIYRLRTRWRDHVRAAVRATLRDPGDLDDEMQHLQEILRQETHHLPAL